MEPDDLDRLVAIRRACGEGSERDKLDRLVLAYLMTAANVRTEALIEPGEFQVERDRQVAELRGLADLINVDEPDLELERLCQEGDLEGLARYVQKKLAEQGR